MISFRRIAGIIEVFFLIIRNIWVYPYSDHHSEQMNPDGGIERLRMTSKPR